MAFHLTEMVSVDRIRHQVQASDWQEVVRITGQVMEEAGLIESRYIDAMIELIETEGPYLVIAPGIALLHARPEEGVREAGIAICTLSDPVPFGHSSNDPVELVIGLAATTDKSHVQALAELATLLSQPDAVEALRVSTSDEEIYQTIQEYSEGEG
jgi:PTS system ascorbate-specific IIA component